MTNSETGRQIGLYDHIRQSIKNILFTRIGTRLMREEYGSLLPELLDQPITPALLLQCQAAAIAALAKWEPRIEIQAATVSPPMTQKSSSTSKPSTSRPAHLRHTASGSKKMPQIADLSKIPAPDVIEEIDFEKILSARKERFIAEYQTPAERDYWRKVLELESEPVVKLLEECAYSEMLMRQDFNERAKGLMLAYASGSDLDQLAANVDIQRLVITEADYTVEPPIQQVLESDESLRRRVQGAFETLTTAGSEESYYQHAKSAHGQVADIAVISPSGAVVDIVVLSNQAGGVPSESVIKAVTEAVNAKYRRPTADRVTVKAAQIIEYQINAQIIVYPTPDYEPILENARARMREAVDENFKLGRDVDLSMIYAALRVEGVQSVVISQPAAAMPVTQYQAALCTQININYGGQNE